MIIPRGAAALMWGGFFLTQLQILVTKYTMSSFRPEDSLFSCYTLLSEGVLSYCTAPHIYVLYIYPHIYVSLPHFPCKECYQWSLTLPNDVITSWHLLAVRFGPYLLASTTELITGSSCSGCCIWSFEMLLAHLSLKTSLLLVSGYLVTVIAAT